MFTLTSGVKPLGYDMHSKALSRPARKTASELCALAAQLVK